MDLGALITDLSPWMTGEVRVASRWPERRDLQPRILAKVRDSDSPRATVVLGPRQVGKSVMLWQTAEDLLRAGWPPENLLYFDFSDDRIVEPLTVRDVLETSARLRAARAEEVHDGLPVVLLLDEISRVPNWGRWLKAAVDAGGHRIVATDSAASVLREGGRESGYGRWDEWSLEGLSFREFRRIAPDGDPLRRFLLLGGFPAYASWLEYADARRALREDVAHKALERDLGRYVDDVDAARRLFVYLMQDSGAIYNASNRERDLGVGRKLATQWVQLFLDSRLLVELPRRALDAKGRKAKAARRLGAHPKLFAADHGLIHAFSPLPDPDSDPVVQGQVYESVVFRHLREIADRDPMARLSFHLHRGEGDFVLDLADRVVAVEVTSARTGKGKLAKLAAVRAEVGADRAVLVYGGIDAREQEGVSLVPLPMFLEDPAGVALGEGA